MMNAAASRTLSIQRSAAIVSRSTESAAATKPTANANRIGVRIVSIRRSSKRVRVRATIGRATRHSRNVTATLANHASTITTSRAIACQRSRLPMPIRCSRSGKWFPTQPYPNSSYSAGICPTRDGGNNQTIVPSLARERRNVTGMLPPPLSIEPIRSALGGRPSSRSPSGRSDNFSEVEPDRPIQHHLELPREHRTCLCAIGSRRGRSNRGASRRPS